MLRFNSTCVPRQATVATKSKRVIAGPSASANVCSTCGVAKGDAEKGCDGEGRVMGGMGAVPGFGWWPIKAYRPCPKLSEAGIEYTRKGQATNDVLFGGASLGKEGVATLEEMRRTSEKGIKIK